MCLNTPLFKGKKWQNVAAVIAISITWVVLLWTAFGTDRCFSLYMDNEFFLGTVASAMSDAFRGGELPLRATTMLGGLPTYNLAQLSPFYPFYFIPLHLFGSPIDAARAMHWITLLHLFLLAINLYILIREMGGSRIGAVTGASVVAFGANMLAYAYWMNIIAPYAWFPLYLAGLLGVIEKRASARYIVMAIGAIVMLVYASPSQPLVHAVFITCALIAGRCLVQLKAKTPLAELVPYPRLLSIAVLAFLLAAPVVLPAVTEFKDMIRWIGPFPPVSGYERIPFDAFLIDQMSLAELGGVLVKVAPKAVGSPYVGPVVIGLAAIAVVARRRSWVTLTLAAVALYSLASSTGSHLGLVYINYHLPLLNKLREPSRFLFLFQLSVGVMAAMGIDELRRLAGEASALREWRLPMVIMGVVAVLSVVSIPLVQGAGLQTIPTVMSLTVFVGAGIMTVVLSRLQQRLKAEMIGVVWAAAALIVLAMNVRWIPPTLSASHYLNHDGIALEMAIKRVAALDPGREYRLIFGKGVDKQMAAMLASYQGVRSLSSYFNPAPRRQFKEIYQHGPRSDQYFQILGARFLICQEGSDSEYPGYVFREHVNRYDIYEASNALPYLQLVQRLDGRYGTLDDFTGTSASHDLSQGLLFVEARTRLALGRKEPSSPKGLLQMSIRKNNLVRCFVSSDAPSVLILNEFHADPWRVSIDGKKARKLKVNGNQMGVQIGAGSHMVEFAYRPKNFRAGVALCAIGALALLIWGWGFKFNRTAS